VFVGHADARGTEALNLSLSRQRAEAIYRDWPCSSRTCKVG